MLEISSHPNVSHYFRKKNQSKFKWKKCCFCMMWNWIHVISLTHNESTCLLLISLHRHCNQHYMHVKCLQTGIFWTYITLRKHLQNIWKQVRCSAFLVSPHSQHCFPVCRKQLFWHHFKYLPDNSHHWSTPPSINSDSLEREWQFD